MPAIGADVNRRLRTIFTLAAAMAGVAGALLAQTTRFVGIDVLGFQRSAELLIILAFGGTGRLYGALLGRRGVHRWGRMLWLGSARRTGSSGWARCWCCWCSPRRAA